MRWFAVDRMRDIAWTAGTAAGVILATALGILALQELYGDRTIGPGGFQAVLAGVAVGPAAFAHVLRRLRGDRSFLLWLLWLPGLAAYAAVPYRGGDGWVLLGIARFARIWAQLMFRYPDAVGPDERIGMIAFATVLSAALLTAGCLWHGGLTWMRRRSGGVVSAGSRRRRGEPGLPSATWADRREVMKRYSAPGGIVLGEMTNPETETPDFHAPDRRSWGRQGRGPLITMDPANGNGHVLVTSQAAAYKTTGLVLPNILTYHGPLLVFDPKCEVYARTRKAREAMGFKPVVIDETSPFDPARLIASLAMDHPSAFRRMARMIIPNETGGVENARFFQDAAEALLGAMLGYCAETGSTNILGDIARLLSMDPQSVFATVVGHLDETRWNFVLNQLGALSGMDPRLYGSIKTVITNQLVFVEYPDVARFINMTKDSPLVKDVLDPETDVFLNVPQHVAEDYPALVKSILGSFLIAAQLIEQPESPRARRLILIDEAAKLGRMDTLADIRDRGRAIGLHLMMVYQTPGELVRIWGQAGATSWRDGCSAVVTGPVTARTSATDLSTMLGTKTIRVMTESRTSSNQVMAPVSGSVSRAEQEQLRDVPLLSPTEIAKLPRHASIITSPGFRPILATKAISFTRPDMASRVRSSEEIEKELQVTKSRKEFLKRMETAEREGPKTGTAAAAGTASPEPDTEVHENGIDGVSAAERSVIGDAVLSELRPEQMEATMAEHGSDDTESPLDLDALDIDEGFETDHGTAVPPETPDIGPAVTFPETDGRTGGTDPPTVSAANEAGGEKGGTVSDTGDGHVPKSGSAPSLRDPADDRSETAEWKRGEVEILIRVAGRGDSLDGIVEALKRPEADVIEKLKTLERSGVVRWRGHPRCKDGATDVET